MSVIVASRGERWRAALAALADRDFALLWAGGGFQALARAALNIALMKLIYDQTGSASGVGLLVFTNVFSMAIATPVGGVLTDRLDRKKLFIAVSAMRAVLVLLFLWGRSPLAIYSVNFALAVVITLSFPVGSAILPDVVNKEQLLDANALNLSLGTLMMILGPLLGGFLVDRLSAQAVFALCGALFLVSALSVLPVRVPPPSILRGEATLRAVYEEFVEGLRYARVNPVVSTLTIIYFVFLVGFGLKMGLDMVFAEQVLSGDLLSASTAYSYITSASAVGMFTGSLLVRYLGRRFARKRLLLTGVGTISLDALGLVFIRSLPLALVTKFAGGLGWGLSDSIWPTLLQENVEEDKRGRAFSLFLGVVTIPPAITVYLGGWLADHTSLQLVYGLAGGWVLLTAIGGRFLPGYRAIPEHSEEEVVVGPERGRSDSGQPDWD